jgi:hypothetical protein
MKISYNNTFLINQYQGKLLKEHRVQVRCVYDTQEDKILNLFALTTYGSTTEWSCTPETIDDIVNLLFDKNIRVAKYLFKILFIGAKGKINDIIRYSLFICRTSYPEITGHDWYLVAAFSKNQQVNTLLNQFYNILSKHNDGEVYLYNVYTNSCLVPSHEQIAYIEIPIKKGLNLNHYLVGDR